MSTTMEALIAEVYKRHLLWDHRNKEYHNRQCVDMAWSSVAHKLGVGKNYAKSRWKSLRDTFRKEFKKFKEQRLTGGLSVPIPRWVHYKDLQFLEDVMLSRKMSSNVLVTSLHEKKYQPPQAHDEEIKSKGDRQEYDAEFSDEDASTISHSRSASTLRQPRPLTTAQKYKRAKSSLNYQKENLHVEKKEMEWAPRQQDGDDDDDLNFFKSLVPYMKKLPPYKKLCLRSQFQNLLANEISAIENNSVHPSPAPRPQTVVEPIQSHMT